LERIGVRELRQYASVYLARVEDGETLEVTDRGRPVAMLVPVKGDPWHGLIASGRVAPPTEEGDVLDEGPQDYGVNVSERLADMRDEER
jgi:prevent-host-death family protein